MRAVSILIVICLSLVACATKPPPSVTSTNKYYVVRPQDNFYSIAFAFELTVDQLRAANPWLSPSSIAPGMRLSIPQTGLSEPIKATGHPARFIWPLKRLDISSQYGYRSGSLHAGIDLRAPRGTDIHASAAGRVTLSSRQNGYGRMVIVDHGNGLQTVYAHNHRNYVGEGETVRQGQVIASVGRSGNATGYHVHFEMRRAGKAVNPLQYLGP